MGVLIEVLFILVYLVVFLFVLTISVVYTLGYIQDALLGEWLINHVLLFINKLSKSKKRNILKKFEGFIKPKDMYMRYETPLCTYCFSFSALSIIMAILNSLGTRYVYVIAILFYITVYFVGMYRRYRSDMFYYRILENNMDFLKLSFIPLTFLITVGGFLFTITGYRIQETDLNYFSMIIQIFTEYDKSKGAIGDILYYFKSGIFILLIMYIMSIPMQLISYLVLQVIFYFKKHNKAYKKLLKCYIEILNRIRP